MNDFVLRRLTQEDGEHLFRLTSDENVARYMRFSVHKELAQAQALLAEYLKGAAFAIEIAGKFAGVFAFQGGDCGEYGLSTFLSKDYWNQGYSTKILDALLPWARQELGAVMLTAHVVGSNTGSRRVLEKLGFSVAEVKHFDGLPEGLYLYRKAVS